jgi:flagellar hook-associated protein 3 FlgL
MRIATSTIYDQQTAAIDNKVAQQANFGNQLSTGKAVTMPSDDPTHIAQDLGLGTSIAQENTSITNISNATAELNTVDSSMASLTNILQSARQIAVQAASDTLTPIQRQSLGKQVDGLLTESIGLANTNYAGKYVFAGTVSPSVAPVSGTGVPTSAVNFTGNLQSQSQQFANGQSLQLSATMQQAFNFQAPDGSADVFQVLMNLRNTLNASNVDDESAASVNKAGTVIAPTTTLASANFSTPLTPDSSGNISISVSGSLGSQTFTFAPTAPVGQDPTNPVAGSVVDTINAASGATGVTASFDPKTERITFKSANNVPFRVDNVPSPGATNTSNFTSAFGINAQGDVVGNISRQLGEIDHVLNAVLNTRAVVGGNIQSLNSLKDQNSSLVVNNTKVQSGIEDADIAKVVSEFSQTQTALQAAYATTTRLESKTLFDFVQ